MNAQALNMFVSLFALASSTGIASAVDVQVSGSDWGIWLNNAEDVFFGANADGTTAFSATDDGSGVSMDFDMTLPDGTRLNGSDLTSRTVMATFEGVPGDSQLSLFDWSVWVGNSDVFVHIDFDFFGDEESLILTYTNPDGTFNYASLFQAEANVSLHRSDGSVEAFTRSTSFFAFNQIPSPGAASLLGLSGAYAFRRRRA